MKKCPKCNKHNPDNTDNCLFCRAPLTVPEEKKIVNKDENKSDNKGAKE